MKSLFSLLALSMLLVACEEDRPNTPLAPDNRFGSFIDARDNQQYVTVQIGAQKWMAENLNWAGEGYCYDEDSSNCDKYGRMYSAIDLLNGETPVDESALLGIKGICPDGWHLPSALEWNELIIYLGADSTIVATQKTGIFGVTEYVGNKLKADKEWSFPSGNAFANESGFAALPCGYMIKDATNNFTSLNLGGDALFWTASYHDSTKTQLQIRTLKDDLSGDSELGIRTGRLDVDDKWYTACRCVED